MGRSKFPGKPSKHILKKRVSVIPPSRDAADNNNSSSVYDAPTASTTSEQLNNENDCDNGSKSDVINYQSPRPSKIIDSCKAKKRRKSKKNLISSLRANGFKSKLRSTPKNRKRIRKQVDNGTPGSIQRQLTRSAFESKGVVGKFVLPSRSIHSSRVIKPNKRFINVDINETTSLKRKILSKALCPKSSKVMSVKRLNEKNNKFNNKNFNSITERISKEHVILRQARLKLHSQNMVKPAGPFSSNLNMGSPPGTVTCGVCGAVRFYRFIKQARKFNIYSCESCRKFISKMIKRQSCKSNSSTLVCHKGHGMCHVPPIVRSQQCKLTRSAYRARCPACWLKMCLRSFQMPSTLKNNLIQLLPENMQEPSFFISNSSVLPYQPLLNTNIKRKITDIKLSEPIFKRCPVRIKNDKVPFPAPSPILPDSNINRQKFNVKGPRVKHVCRSASIVLGQPIAMFSYERSKLIEAQDSSTLEAKKKSTQEATKNKCIVSLADNGSDKVNKPLVDPKPIVPSTQEDKKQKNSSAVHVPVPMPVTKAQSKQIRSKLKSKISIDYWKHYDQSKTTDMGYCLIATEQFSITAVCYLCGSAGKENLLYCSLCCEPYHLFCLDQSCFLRGVMSKEESWLCPKCTVCVVCHQSSEKKVECQKCCKTYHPRCLSNTRPTSGILPVVCSECSLCKSCGSSNATQFIINTPLCESCFKLKCPNKKCPSCQECYDKHYAKNQIIECESCKGWIHLKCSSICDEDQVVLSVLPEPIGYTCDGCAEHTKPYWQAAVNFKLNLYLCKILQQLSQNRNARNLLKWNFNNSHKTQGLTTRRSNEKSLNSEYSSDSGSNEDCREEGMKFDNYAMNEMYDELPFGNVRSKIYAKSYKSVHEFNSEMEALLDCAGSEQLIKIYQNILNKTFPQFSSTDPSTNSSPDAKHMEDLIVAHKDSPLSNVITYDTRLCTLCKQSGDGLKEHESRLLYCGNNTWVHANCALWSQEVYENINGFLRNIHTALSRGKTTCCAFCKQTGATVNCSHKDCLKIYHFQCAQKSNCIFAFNKLVFCSTHYTSHSHLTICKSFTVSRPLYIEKNDAESYTEIEKVSIMIGSLRISSLGKINCLLSDSNDAIIPIGFRCTRLYWSTIEPWKVASYSITTSAGSCHINTPTNVDTNFTINHALPSHMVNQKLKEMSQWFKEVDRKNNLIDSEDEEENQNSADLLSPELTDAIFEEIPHDLLDRISVQDIFPKLINYDDLLNSDLKFDESLAKQTKTDKEIRSELLLRNRDKTTDTKNQSCSVTVSCKVNRSVSPSLKKKKVIAKQSNLLVHLVQLDGQIDDSDSESCLFDIRKVVNKKVNKRHNKMKELPQLDGNSDDTVSRELEYFLDTSKRQKLGNSEEPVTCSRCHCTYRTTLSYNKHLDSCEVVTSESDSEMVEQDTQIPTMNITVLPNTGKTQEDFTSVPFIDYSQGQSQKGLSIFIPDKTVLNIKTPEQKCLDIQGTNINLNHNFVNTSTGSMTPVFFTQQPNSMDAAHNSLYSIGQPMITFSAGENKHCTTNQLPVYTNQAIPTNVPINVLVNSSGQVEGALNVINTPCINYSNAPITINPSSESTNIQNYQPVSITHPVSVANQPLQYINNGNSYVAIDPQATLNSKILANSGILNNSLVLASDTVPKNNTITANNEESLTIKNAINKPNETYIIQGNSPTVMMQNVPSANYVSYIAQPYPHEECKPTVTPQITTQMQPVTQLQPDNTISIIPTLQPTVVIQQPQYILDNNIPITITQQPVAPPMYYGFETIIQNTVMASQQILPSAVPGVITANSSYSTTTQVFQTSSKLEPIIDLPQSALVVVSSGQIIGTVPLQLSYSQTPTPQFQVNTLGEMNSALKVTDSNNTPPNSSNKTVANNMKAITLPTAPLVMKKEQGIPTNIVAPNPKATNVVQPTPKPPNRNFRPMNRVLPMKKNVVSLKKPVDEVDKPITKDRESFSAVVDEKSKTIYISKNDCQEFSPQVKELFSSILPENTQSLKSMKQKENTNLRQYSNKISHNKPEKLTMQVPVAPVKQAHALNELNSQLKREMKQGDFPPERFITNDIRSTITSAMATKSATVTTSAVPKTSHAFNVNMSTHANTPRGVKISPAVTSTKSVPSVSTYLTFSASVPAPAFQPPRTQNYLTFQSPVSFPHIVTSTAPVPKQTFAYTYNTNPSSKALTSAPRMKNIHTTSSNVSPAYMYGATNCQTHAITNTPTSSPILSVCNQIPASKPMFLPCSSNQMSTSIPARSSITIAPPLSTPLSVSKFMPALQSMPSLAPCPPPPRGNIPMSFPSSMFSSTPISSPKVTSKYPSSQNQTASLKSPLSTEPPRFNTSSTSNSLGSSSVSVGSPKSGCTLVPSTYVLAASSSNKTVNRSSKDVTSSTFSVSTPRASSFTPTIKVPKSTPPCSGIVPSSCSNFTQLGISSMTPANSHNAPITTANPTASSTSSVCTSAAVPVLAPTTKVSSSTSSTTSSLSLAPKVVSSLHPVYTSAAIPSCSASVSSANSIGSGHSSRTSTTVTSAFRPDIKDAGSIFSAAPIHDNTGAKCVAANDIKNEESINFTGESSIENRNHFPITSSSGIEIACNKSDFTMPISNNCNSQADMLYTAPSQSDNKDIYGTTNFAINVTSNSQVVSSYAATSVTTKSNHIGSTIAVASSATSTATSTVHARKKSTEKAPAILYTIETQDGHQYSSTNLNELWKKVLETVENARAAHNIPTVSKKSPSNINGIQLLGLNSDSLKYLIEQLPGAAKCSKYGSNAGFSVAQTESEDESPFGHISGAIRCAPYVGNSHHDSHDMFGWLTSKHRKPEYNTSELDLLPRRNSVSNLPMTMRFRQLKLTSKLSVGVYRSKIHRRGLFCLRDIEAGEMVIEYAGEVIRSVLCDKREKHYNSKGIGCYMFRVDDNLVVDATMKGNAARFINHSCDPNCYSKVVEIFGHKHIIIFALRKILCGEELTYDYKFPFEEDKIPCTCGSRRCRKFLN